MHLLSALPICRFATLKLCELHVVNFFRLRCSLATAEYVQVCDSSCASLPPRYGCSDLIGPYNLISMSSSRLHRLPLTMLF